METALGDVGLLLIRLVFGLSFVGFGLQTLFGWLGGDGFRATVDFFESIRMRPARLFAALNGGGELVAGLLLAAGLLTRFAGATLAVMMAVAIVTVAGKKPYWSSMAFQYCVATVAVGVAMALTGPGRFSLDAMIGLWGR